MSNLTPAEFYLLHYDASDPFDNPRPEFGTKHRGIDVNGLPLGEPIPSWLSGKVVRVFTSSALGNVTVVQRADGLYAGFCHLNEHWATVGQSIDFGQAIGPLGATGIQAHGPHVHLTASWLGDDPGTSIVVNPWPLIQESIRNHQEEDMHIIGYILDQGIGSSDPRYGSTAVLDLTAGTLTDTSTGLGDRNKFGALTGAAVKAGIGKVVNCDTEVWDYLHNRKWSPSSVPPLDYTKLATAIKASGALDLVIAGTARPAAVTK